jgi:branched-chain amino acid transport system permease protein
LERRWLDTNKRPIGYLIGIAVAIILPVVVNYTGLYWMGVLILIGIYAILATSLNLIMGYTGQADLAHSALYGVGAYAAGIFAIRLGINFWVTLPLAGLVSVAAGSILGLITLRLRGTYFALACSAFLFLMAMVFTNWRGLTGGIQGLLRIPSPSIGGLVVHQNDKILWSYIVFGVLLLTVFIVDRIVHSRIGRALIAIREDEDLAKSTGVNTFWYKMIAFVIATFFAGVTGAVFAAYNGMVTPTNFNIVLFFMIVASCFLGGLGTMLGPVIGAIIVVLLPEVLRVTGQYYLVIFGVFIIIATIFAPNGVMGLVTSLRKRLTAARRRDEKVVD